MPLNIISMLLFSAKELSLNSAEKLQLRRRMAKWLNYEPKNSSSYPPCRQ